MLILFPSHPLNRKEVDPQFEPELEAAKAAGFDCRLICTQSIDTGDYKAAVRFLPEETLTSPWTGAKGPGAKSLLRGWMMREEEYGKLYRALQNRGYTLINTQQHYKNCHHLPESLHVLGDRTPHTEVIPRKHSRVIATIIDYETGDKSEPKIIDASFDVDDIIQAVNCFPQGCPVIIKDYVKSEKQAWPDACFIEDPRDKAQVLARVIRFLKLRDSRLTGGLVLREFVEFEGLGGDPRKKAPQFNEHRIFWYKGPRQGLSSPYAQPLYLTQYQGDPTTPKPDPKEFQYLASRIPSNFFSMDLVRRKDNGEWMVLEMGDGQVAGLPAQEDPHAFYRALAVVTGVEK
jgi:hypothetical protein